MDIQKRCFKCILPTLMTCMAVAFILSCAGLDPRNIDLELETESPAPQKTIFSEILGKLGEMTEIYASRSLNIQCLAVVDDTGSALASQAEIPRDITEMLKSALNAIGGRVTYIPDSPNYIANQINLGLRSTMDGIAVPDVIITGGITEFDRGLQTKGKNLDLSAEETVADRPVGFDYSNAQKASIASITLDFNLINAKTMAGLPRMQTTNSIRVHKAVSERELAFTLLGPTIGFKGTLKKIQGRHEAVRLLVQMSVIQMVGRYLKLPYWNLLPNAQPDPDVIEALKADYRQMSLSQRIATIQKLLLHNGFVVPVTGTLDTQTKVALQKWDNRFESYQDVISEDLFLNLYFSVPVDHATMTAALTRQQKDHHAALDKTEENVMLPTVDAIVQALNPDQGISQPTLRGAAGRRDKTAKELDTSFSIDLPIPFELNQYQISDMAIPCLQRLGTAMADARLKDSVVEIQGHTCNLGRAEYNLWLSQKRAEAVKHYLVSHFGYSPDQFRAVGYGMKSPKWPNDTEAGRAANRRVTIVNTLKAIRNAKGRPDLEVAATYLHLGKEMEIRPGTALSSQDNYALAFTADQTCYIYVFQFDTQKSVTQLFPNTDFGPANNPVGPKQSCRVPANGRGWLYLDDNHGEEELIVLAYPEPLPDPLKVAFSLTGQYDSTLFPFPDDGKSLATRGPKGVRQAPEDILFVWRKKFAHVN